MPYEFIDLEVNGPVGWYRFNGPPRNAANWEMLAEMATAFEAILQQPEVKVVVIASALERYFHTGADVAAFKGVDAEKMRDWVETTHRLANTIRNAPKPILAAINGIAVGGGLEMTLHADLRFAASDARLGQPEVNIGFIPPIAGTQGLVRLIGRGYAFRMLYSGELIDAETALSFGLVDFIAPPEALIEDVQAYGEMLATKPANTLAAIRRCLIDGGSRSFEDGMEIEKAEVIALAGHANFSEGVSAFLEKRSPEWR
jgi:enoyl-CoA hydratase/carnithine racemase